LQQMVRVSVLLICLYPITGKQKRKGEAATHPPTEVGGFLAAHSMNGRGTGEGTEVPAAAVGSSGHFSPSAGSYAGSSLPRPAPPPRGRHRGGAFTAEHADCAEQIQVTWSVASRPLGPCTP
jgi:hypothetical protein